MPYRYMKFTADEYRVIDLLIKELVSEREKKVYSNRTVIEAVEFYKKYRKLVR